MAPIATTTKLNHLLSNFIYMSDIFRRNYKQLSDQQKTQMDLLKSAAENVARLIENNTNPENLIEMDYATKDLRQSIMWAINGITK